MAGSGRAWSHCIRLSKPTPIADPAYRLNLTFAVRAQLIVPPATAAQNASLPSVASAKSRIATSPHRAPAATPNQLPIAELMTAMMIMPESRPCLLSFVRRLLYLGFAVQTKSRNSSTSLARSEGGATGARGNPCFTRLLTPERMELLCLMVATRFCLKTPFSCTGQ